MPPAKTSRIDAVNAILRAAGETPVANLSDNAGVQSVMAEATLDDIDREVQSLGWSWNRTCQTLQVDANGVIPMRDAVVRVDTADARYTVRGGNLFDLIEASTDFSTVESVSAHVVEMLDWEDLPEQARRYIAIKAARRYCDQSIGDDALSRYTRQDEQESYMSLRRHELKLGNYNMFAPSDMSYINRARPLDI